MSEKFCYRYSLKCGSIVAGIITCIPCTIWFCYTLYVYAYGKYDTTIIKISFIASGIMLIISLFEIFGALIKNKWLILPWLIVYGFIFVITPFILLVCILFNVYIIFGFIIYFISTHLWSVVASYYRELCHEQTLPDSVIHKLCAPFYLFDVPSGVWFCIYLILCMMNYTSRTHTINLAASGILLFTALLEIFGACVEIKWLILPWIIIYGFVLMIIPFALVILIFFEPHLIFFLIVYFIYAPLWWVVYSYYKELCSEPSLPDTYIHKLCAPFYLFDVLYLSDIFYKAWCSIKSTQQIHQDVTQRNQKEIIQEDRV